MRIDPPRCPQAEQRSRAPNPWTVTRAGMRRRSSMAEWLHASQNAQMVNWSAGKSASRLAGLSMGAQDTTPMTQARRPPPAHESESAFGTVTCSNSSGPSLRVLLTRVLTGEHGGSYVTGVMSCAALSTAHRGRAGR